MNKSTWENEMSELDLSLSPTRMRAFRNESRRTALGECSDDDLEETHLRDILKKDGRRGS